MRDKLLAKTMFIATLLIISISLIGLASALGVTPAMRTVDYKPGQMINGSFTIVNSEHEDMNLLVSVEGDLNQSTRVFEREFTMKASEDSRTLDYELTIPYGLKPGPHSADIVILQPLGAKQGGKTFIGSALAVKMQVVTNVPYPGKYLEAALSIIGSAQGGEVTFTIPMVNKGQWDLVSVRANIDIYDGNNRKIESFNTAEISIKSGERKELVERWTANIPQGVYKAIVTLIFDENTVMLEGTFNVGEMEVELQEVRVKDYQLGGIAKFEMLVENKWGEQVRQIYSQTQVYNDKGEVLADFKSPTYDIDALTKKILVSYWDTAGVSVGNYDASVFLRYSDKSSRKDLKFSVQEDKIEIFGLGYVISESKSAGEGSYGIIIILLVVMIVLLIINSVWFLMLRKKFREK